MSRLTSVLALLLILQGPWSTTAQNGTAETTPTTFTASTTSTAATGTVATATGVTGNTTTTGSSMGVEVKIVWLPISILMLTALLLSGL